jgi:hypothetical protein
MGIVVLDRYRRIAWRSPQALRFLEQAFDREQDAQLVHDWLNQVLRKEQAFRRLADGLCIHARYVGQAEFGESMVLLQLAPASKAADQRSPMWS